MALVCPDCGATNFRFSKIRSLKERCATLLGVYPFRCGSCGVRFNGRIWRFSNLVYAKCPRCHKLDLSRWSEKYYRPGTWITMKLALGAKALRCEYCRHNFAGFRPVKERFSWHKRAGRSTVRIPVQGDEVKGARAGQMAGDRPKSD